MSFLDVAETEVGSRAFTIVYILLGASCVGGALALFIQDMMEGIDGMKNGQFELLLANDALQRADTEGKGRLTYEQFRGLLEEWRTGPPESNCNSLPTDGNYVELCRKFDPRETGFIEFKSFLRQFRDLDGLLRSTSVVSCRRNNQFARIMFEMGKWVKQQCSGSNRIFITFLVWVLLGISWGKIDQQWDTITATHFAISALATGGLTAPPVDSNGILPANAAIFCGVYCLFGIPLMALTFAHFARLLVEGHVLSEVKSQIDKPLDLTEFELAKNLCTEDSVIHLSDFIVLQLLRQGKISRQMVNLIKAKFERLDTNRSGVLSLDQATSRVTAHHGEDSLPSQSSDKIHKNK